MTIPVFQKFILAWYAHHGRTGLPWRKTHNPYRILVSEMMLQQTQVDRVLPKYTAFLKMFPNPQALANTSVHDVLTQWKGLGYNRRALFLHRAAKKIMTDFGGRFPRTIKDIESLPGVGPYTARAIATFAYGEAVPFVETNIRRIFLHFFFPEESSVSDAQILPLVEKALYTKDPHVWYSALMDYGALAMGDVKNPNQRSRHYAKQSKFEGSRRYARAKILEYILKKQPVVLSQLQSYVAIDPHLEVCSEEDALKGILSDLVKEGFIVKKANTWRIVE